MVANAKNRSEAWGPLPRCPACGRELHLIEVAGTMQCANCGWVYETCCEGGVPLEGDGCPIPESNIPPKKTEQENFKNHQKSRKDQKKRT